MANNIIIKLYNNKTFEIKVFPQSKNVKLNSDIMYFYINWLQQYVEILFF